MRETKVPLTDRVQILNLLAVPVWIFDIERSRMIWGNGTALSLWGAKSLSELCERDMCADMGRTVQRRLLGYLREFREGRTVRERWTFYPLNQPRTVLCTCSGIELDDERLAMLVEGSIEESVDEDSLRSLEAVRHTSVMISVYSEDGRLLSRNPAAEAAFSGDERTFLDHFPSEQHARELLTAMEVGGACAAEIPVHTSDGVRWHLLELQRSRDPVSGGFMIVVGETDISRRRQAESNLRESEVVLRALLDASNEAMCFIDRDGRVITGNETLARRLGVKLGDVVGRCVFDFFPSELALARRNALEYVCRTGEPLQFEDVQSGRYFQNSLQPVRDSRGAVNRVAVFSYDVTELKRTERALSESLAFKRAVLDSVSAHIAVIDEDGVILATNYAWDDFARKNGWRGPQSSVGMNYLEICERAEGHDREVARAAGNGLRAVLTGEVAEFVMDYSCHSPDEQMWFNLRATRMGDEGALRAVLSHEDITNVKAVEKALMEREDALRRSEALYRTIASHLPNGAVIVFDKELRYTFVDGLGLRDHHLRREDLEGKTLWELFSEDVCIPLAALYRKALEGNPDKVEILVDGAYYLVRTMPLRGSNGEIYGGLALTQDVTAIKQVQRELEETNACLHALSQQDGLLGIANRRCLDDALSRECYRLGRCNTHLALLMIDVDHFKAYNDSYGHLAGDECLRQVSTVLREAVRRPADLVSRFGGEEFVILLPETDNAGAEDVANRIRTRLAELALPHATSPLGAVVTVSIGVVGARPSATSCPQSLLAAADAALYRAKRKGRNCIEFSSG